MCPAVCQAENCERELNKPYKLPCGHHIGEHCKEKIQQRIHQDDDGTLHVCPVAGCSDPLPDSAGMKNLKVNATAQKTRYLENDAVLLTGSGPMLLYTVPKSAWVGCQQSQLSV